MATKNTLGKTLLNLSEKDLKICQAENRKTEILNIKSNVLNEQTELKEKLLEKTTALDALKARQKDEESKVKEEEAKISDRRKQLVDLGGAKVAKLLEREVEIAAKAMQLLEANAAEAKTQSDAAKAVVDEVTKRLKEIDKIVSTDFVDLDAEDSTLTKELKSLRSEKEKIFSGLDSRLQNLYKRVNVRYPASTVAIASKNSCRSCFRALPQQTYNQIIAGYSMIQCPGCSRILVYGDSEA